MRRMARGTAFDLEGRMFKNKRSLLVGMASHAGHIVTDGKFGLLRLKTAVSIMTIAALHRSFHNFVPEGLAEMRLYLAVARNAELLFVGLKHRRSRVDVGSPARECRRTGPRLFKDGSVRRVTIRTADVVAPVIAAAEIVVTFFAGVTREARFGNGLRVHVLETLYL